MERFILGGLTPSSIRRSDLPKPSHRPVDILPNARRMVSSGLRCPALRPFCLDTREIRLVRIGWSGPQPTVCLAQNREKRLMPVGRFRGEGGWVEVDSGTGT